MNKSGVLLLGCFLFVPVAVFSGISCLRLVVIGFRISATLESVNIRNHTPTPLAISAVGSYHFPTKGKRLLAEYTQGFPPSPIRPTVNCVLNPGASYLLRFDSDDITSMSLVLSDQRGGYRRLDLRSSVRGECTISDLSALAIADQSEIAILQARLPPFEEASAGFGLISVIFSASALISIVLLIAYFRARRQELRRGRAILPN